MSEHLDRARRYHDAIRRILVEDWDPIGVAGVAGAEDEYDSYISKIHAMLIRHEPRHELIDHLWWIERSAMRLAADRRRTEAVVDRLIALRDEMEAGR